MSIAFPMSYYKDLADDAQLFASSRSRKGRRRSGGSLDALLGEAASGGEGMMEKILAGLEGQRSREEPGMVAGVRRTEVFTDPETARWAENFQRSQRAKDVEERQGQTGPLVNYDNLIEEKEKMLTTGQDKDGQALDAEAMTKLQAKINDLKRRRKLRAEGLKAIGIGVE